MQQPHADDNLHHRGRDKRVRSHDYSVFTTKKDEINGLLGKVFLGKAKGEVELAGKLEMKRQIDCFA